MNVGVTTIHNHLNYGAVLQVYALTNTIRRLGHACQVIDNDFEPGHGRTYTRSRHPGEQIKNLYLAWHRRAGHRFCDRFNEFLQQHVPKTDRTYRSFDELATHPPQFDAFITGSDQVWNPGLLGRQLGPLYHLEFADPKKARLVSYAPSFGVDQLPEHAIGHIRSCLLRYHALSVREKRGQEIIREISGRKAAHVVDPTLLLSPEDYAPVTAPPRTVGEYMLVYPMEVGANFSFYHLVKLVKKMLGIPVVVVLPLNFHHRWMLLADRLVLDAGPKEFLGLISNATFVCTNSFHGTVFSILFQKNFLGVPHTRTNARVHSLLDKLNLLDRQLVNWDEQAVKTVLQEAIDYPEVTLRLEAGVKHSLTFLRNALSA